MRGALLQFQPPNPAEILLRLYQVDMDLKRNRGAGRRSTSHLLMYAPHVSH